MRQNHKESKSKIETCHKGDHDIENPRSGIFPKYDNGSKQNKEYRGIERLHGKCIFKGRGHGIADYLADSRPANQTGQGKKQGNDASLLRDSFLQLLSRLIVKEKIMDVIGRPATKAAIKGIFPLMELRKGRFNKGGGRTD